MAISKSNFEFLHLLTCILLLNNGCIYSSTDVWVSCDNPKQDELVRFDVGIEQLYSCIYPPETLLARSLFGVCEGDDGRGMLLEFILRSPTVVFETLYNVFADDSHVLLSIENLKFSNELFEQVCIKPNLDSFESIVYLRNGRKITIPYLCCKEEDSVNLKKISKRDVYILKFCDSDGWLWFGGVMEHKRLFGYCYYCRQCAEDIIMFKVSCETGKIVPVITRGLFDRVNVDFSKSGIIEDRRKYRRTYWNGKGVSSVFLQNRL